MMLDTAIVCYFMCYSKRCMLYAHMAKISKEDPEQTVKQYEEYVLQFNDCVDTMAQEFDACKRKVETKINDLKKHRREALQKPAPKSKGGIPDMLEIMKDMRPLFNDYEGEPSQLLDLGGGNFTQWIVEDKTSGRSHTLYIGASPAITVGSSVELLQKNLKEAYVPVNKNFERMKAMLEEHIEGHFPTTPTILAICKNFIDERKSFKLA